MNTNDLRYRKTEKNLFETYKKLLAEGKKPITLVRLCDEAMINKSTFYQHYKTLEQMRLEICRNAVRSILEKIDGIENPFADTKRLCTSTINAFLKEKDCLELLFGKNIQQMYLCVETEILTFLLKNESNSRNILKIKFAAAGLSRIIFEDQRPATIDTVISMVETLFAE